MINKYIKNTLIDEMKVIMAVFQNFHQCVYCKTIFNLINPT